MAGGKRKQSTVGNSSGQQLAELNANTRQKRIKQDPDLQPGDIKHEDPREELQQTPDVQPGEIKQEDPTSGEHIVKIDLGLQIIVLANLIVRVHMEHRINEI